MLANDALTPGNHQKGRALFTDVVLVLARPFQPETILFPMDENRNNAAAFCSINVEPII